ncbi:MAG: alpha/beta fold hydrolase, partial [Bacteroidetes bacterium]
MKLFSRSYGAGHPLIILHGLLGSGGNWHSLSSNVFCERYRVIVVDQRNHGRSPHSEEFSYDAMTEDVVELMDDLEIESTHLLGHSMGGKTAMNFALQHSVRVDGLVIADIAPVDYPHLHRETLDALLTLDLSDFSSRDEIDSALQNSFPDGSMRNFLMKGVVRAESGFEWMFNLDAINKGYPCLMEAVLGWQPFEGPTLFVHGGKSDYVRQEHT